MVANMPLIEELKKMRKAGAGVCRCLRTQQIR